MLHKLRDRAAGEKGFTLIELLVVILIIGILAAIALPAFLAQRSKAQDTEAKSEARTMQTAMETYYTDEQTYVGADLPTLKKIEIAIGSGKATPSAPSTLTVDTYTVESKSATGNFFWVKKASNGSVLRECGTVSGTKATAATAKGGCKSDGTW